MGDEGATNRALATAQTRASIVAAATDLFASRGFGAVSLRDVAGVAGLSHPGLLRHFASKDVLLHDVVAGLNLLMFGDLDPMEAELDPFARVARHNAQVPGYIALFTGLLGLAASPDNPAHADVQAWYAMSRQAFAEVFADASGELLVPRDPAAEGICLGAAWDGLQLISLYWPDVDTPSMLARRLEILRGCHPQAAPVGVEPVEVPAAVPAVLPSGYKPGRDKRAKIIEAASALFAESGYHGTSLREIAEHVGTGKSTLIHHFGSKERLLVAVLENRDANTQPLMDGADLDPMVPIRALPGWVHNHLQFEAGLVELYATLSTEATVLTHPGHGYFKEHFRTTISLFRDVLIRLQAAGAIAPWRDPAFEALWLVALWDGLQFQWLYDPDSADVPALLQAHLASLIDIDIAAEPRADALA